MKTRISDLPGIVKVVVIRDFVGIVAEREEVAQQAVKRLNVQWKAVEGLPPLETSEEVEAALRANPAKRRDLVIEGDVDAALAQDPARTLERTYVWPFQMHASIGPSCAVADYREGALKVWSGTQNPHSLRADLALLMAHGRSAHRDRAHGSGGLLRPQLRGRCRRRRRVAIARHRQSGARATIARRRARVGAERRRAIDGRARRVEARKANWRRTTSRRAIRRTMRRR